MRSTFSFVAVAGSFALLLAGVSHGRAARVSDARETAQPGRAAEVARLRTHFDSVLAVLPAVDVSHLAASQQTARAELLATLRRYRDRGEFPQNWDFPAQPTPYFVDQETGVVCAVGHLLMTSGRQDIVDRVAGQTNNIHVRELAGDTAFTAWLDRSGLSLGDAAWIQVPYVMDPSVEPRVAESATTLSRGSAVALGGALATSFWNARMNAHGTSRGASLVGMTAGAAAMGFGAASMADGRSSQGIGAAAATVGVASLYLATRGALRQRTALAARSSVPREAPRASMAPIIPIDGVSGAGASLTLRF